MGETHGRDEQHAEGRIAGQADSDSGKPTEDTPVRLVAALDLAGPINRLNWELQIGLLRLEGFYPRCSCAEISTSGLWVQAMDLAEKVADKDSLRDSIREIWSASEFLPSNLLALFRRTEQLHHAAERELHDCRGDFQEFMRVHEEACRRIIAPCRWLVEEIERVCERAMTERQIRVYRLSMMLENLIYPKDVYKKTLGWSPPVEGNDDDIERYFAVGMPSPGFLGRLPGSWLSELKTRMRDCGLDDSTCPTEDAFWKPVVANRKAQSDRNGEPDYFLDVEKQISNISGLKSILSSQLRGFSSGSASLSGDYQAHLQSTILREALPPIGESEPRPIRDVQVQPDRLRVSAKERDRLLKIKEKIVGRATYIGESIAILRAFEQIEVLNRQPDKPVLILGPTGAGKTEIAHLIHIHSGRPEAKFRAEQAADQLADSTAAKGRWLGFGKDHGFHGIEKGGVTGILQDYAGGTVFIDEVADLSLDFQGFLRQVLDRRPIPLTTGKGPSVKPDVRLIFATNQDLERAVREGRFRNDLFDRIRRRSIRIPPLAERKDDIFGTISQAADCHLYSADSLHGKDGVAE